MQKLKWVVAGLVGIVLLVVGGTWVYISFIRADAPERLAISSGTPATSAAATPVAGSTSATPDAAGADSTWKIGEGSIVGYRVDEVINGQNATAVGRTSAVTGGLTLSGTKVTAATFTADMTTVKSDQTRRDNQFHGRIMDTATHPTATFTLTQPIDLGSVPADGAVVESKATGDLTLRGTTRPVTFDVQARRTGDSAEISGAIPITFEEWDIPNPSFATITTEDHGELELLLKLTPAA